MHSRKNLLKAVLVSCSLTLALAGCGDDDDNTTTTLPQANPTASPAASPEPSSSPSSRPTSANCSVRINDNLAVQLSELTPLDTEGERFRAMFVWDDVNNCTNGQCTEIGVEPVRIRLEELQNTESELRYAITSFPEGYTPSAELRRFQREAFFRADVPSGLEIQWNAVTYPMQCRPGADGR